MYSHAPENYDCPFCKLVTGADLPENYSKQSDIFYRTEHVSAFISLRWWHNNPAHAIVIPNEHVENLYTVSFEMGAHLHAAARDIALAFKAVYGCEGVSTRQHNEPAGYQEVFHYHLHVFPRYENDQLYHLDQQWRLTTPEERRPYAEKLRAYFAEK